MLKPCDKCGTEARYPKTGICKQCHSERNAARYATDREKYKALSAARHAKDPARRKALDAARRAANPEKTKAWNDAWRAANPERHQASRAAYAAANAARIKESGAAWHAANPDAGRLAANKRRALKKADGGTLSDAICAKLFTLQKGLCPCCRQPLGKDYHLDHVMPLSLGGTNTDDNAQLLRAKCNLQKKAKHPVDFMQSRGFLL